MKRLNCFLILGLAIVAQNCFAGVENLRCEYLVNPLGISATNPRLSWIMTSDRRGEKQTAYQILVASSPELLQKNQGDLWDSGKTDSDNTSQIFYQGSALVSRQDCFWKVCVWNRDGKPGDWSSPAHWQMGLLQPTDWNAQWIYGEPPSAAQTNRLVIHNATYGDFDSGKTVDVTALVTRAIKENRLVLRVDNKSFDGDPAVNRAKQLRIEYQLGDQLKTNILAERETLTIPEDAKNICYLRKHFALDHSIKRATLYATALGLYEVHLNGQRVGDHTLAPDWTDYRKRVRYQAYDVTELVKSGDNAIAALIGNGWYSGHIGNGGNQFFGKIPAFMAQLEVTYNDGKTERVVTDGSWISHASPVISSDFMLGENYDARLEIKNWDRSDLDESRWNPVKLHPVPDIELDSQVMAPVRQLRELKPNTVTEASPGHWVFDLGQNMVGFVCLKISAPAGTEITVRHAEMLNADGTIYTQNLRGAPSVDHYICDGGGIETWQPHFTFHGFRYVEITGLKDKPSKNTVTGIVIGSDNPQTGEFACSDPRLNQLQSNIQWGQRGNYLSVPTDCPQRDERLGWMGDAEVFIKTATYNSDVASFFTKWLVDVDDGQNAEGSFSDVSPNTMGVNGVPGWGDAGVICPWTIYQTYGDKKILEQHLPAMISWVEYLHEHSDGLIRKRDRGNDYGDWLSINADTPKDLIGTAFFAYSTHLVAQACAVVGHEDDAEKYQKLFQDIKEAFVKEYVSADGHIRGNTQAAYAMALKFELLPDDLKPKAAQYLEDDIKAKGDHLSTGFLGVSYLLPVLTQAGKVDTAYHLLLQDTFPSWLFSVKHGATTIWERWDGWTPEKGFQDPGMNSFNHYSLGSCGEYLFGYIGGIRPASPGYRTIIIDPVIRPELTWAKTSYNSINGIIATDWKVKNNQLNLKVTVPANTTATVYVPAKDSGQVTEGGVSIGKADGIKFLRQENGKAVYEVGSGTYNFASEM